MTSKAEYLKRYLSGGDAEAATTAAETTAKKLKKKKKKKDEVQGAPKAKAIRAPVIFDEDAGLGAAKADFDEEDEELRPQVVEAVEEQKPKPKKKFYGIKQDGSGWTTVDADRPANRDQSPASDVSPPRRGRQASPDVSPPRRGRHDSPSSDVSPPRRGRHDSPASDMSPPRKGRHDSPASDLSPPRRGRHDSPVASPSRKGREASPDADTSPPRKRRHDSPGSDISPPRKGRHDSPGSDISPPRKAVRRESPSGDLSPPRRAGRRAADGDPGSSRAGKEDLSPPRRGRTEDLSPPRRGRTEDLSPPRRGRTEDLSPPRRGRTEDLSPPRRGRTEDLSPPRRGKTEDLSPPRRGKTEDLSPPRRGDKKGHHEGRDKGRMSDGTATGLIQARDLTNELALKRKLNDQKYDKLDHEASGRFAKTNVRDRETGKMLSQEELDQRKRERKEAKQPVKPDWGGGLAQRAAAEHRAAEIQAEASKPFARYSDDAELEQMRKGVTRWGDPMAGKLKPAEPAAASSAFVAQIKSKGFCVPQTVPAHSWLKRGVGAPVNRYGIQPGRHWDGVDRSTGFEAKMFKTKNEQSYTVKEAYKWSTEDM